MYKVNFYQDENGNEPVREYLDKLEEESVRSKDARIKYNKIDQYIGILTEFGEGKMDNEKKISPVGESWSEYRKAHYTAEEIAENDLMVQLVGEVIRSRKENQISQRELENMTGVKQSVIARMESGKTDPKLSTVIKLLASMGKKLSVVPLEMSEKQKI